MPIPKLSDVSSKYGAPMGRRTHTTTNGDQRFYLVKLPLGGDYDAGGAYWGGGGQKMWRYVSEDHEAEGFLRSDTRDIAKGMIKDLYPQARFFR